MEMVPFVADIIVKYITFEKVFQNLNFYDIYN